VIKLRGAGMSAKKMKQNPATYKKRNTAIPITTYEDSSLHQHNCEKPKSHTATCDLNNISEWGRIIKKNKIIHIHTTVSTKT
jgi:hypothetical protein